MQFKFRKHDNIGAADAEADRAFLEACFIDTGDLKELRDCTSPKRIVVGRTGAGKTALLSQLKAVSDRVIEIHPESLSFGYVANSNVLTFFAQAGVNLDLFFKLLWRHIFTVELIKKHYRIETESDKLSWLESFRNLFRDARHRQAIEYLEQWGKSFWQDTEHRIKEITTKLENDLQTSLGASAPPVHLGAEAVQKLSEEQRIEVVQRGQRVVNEVQIRQLSEMLDLLDAALADPQKQYFVVIDCLDENWVDENLRYRLIRALIETIRDFRKIKNTKIVVGMRLDLLSRVFRLTRDSGFQEEKYESLYLHLQWTKEQLTQLLDTRIHHLIKHAYTKQTVTHRDILPSSVQQKNSLDYIFERTMMRPRDAILFLNQCIQLAIDSPMITPKMVLAAEGEYSRLRLRSLADEWSADHPSLLLFSEKFLKNRPQTFRIGDVSDDTCHEIALEVDADADKRLSTLEQACADLVNGKIDTLQFKRIVFSVFYNVGLVALKLSPQEAFLNVTTGRRNVSTAEIDEDARIRINATFRRVFGVKQPNTEDETPESLVQA